MKIVTISGVDGSGKSTQINMLEDYLSSKGKRVYYFHVIEFGIANKIARLKAGTEQAPADKSVIKANIFTILLRRFFMWIDLYRFKDLVRQLRNLGYDYIISDRYFYDSILNVNYLYSKNKNLIIERFIPKPELALYLEVHPDIIMEREKKPDQGRDYLEQKSQLFKQKIDKWGLRVIDASKSEKEIFSEISELVSKL
jgi:dTMP kinase